MIKESALLHCPTCGEKLERTFTFVPYGLKHANFRVCTHCNKRVFLWTLLISRPPRVPREKAFVVLVNVFMDREFVDRARVASSLDGKRLFNEERVFAMTEDEFYAAKKRGGGSEYDIVVGAYRSSTRN